MSYLFPRSTCLGFSGSEGSAFPPFVDLHRVPFLTGVNVDRKEVIIGTMGGRYGGAVHFFAAKEHLEVFSTTERLPKLNP